MLGIGPQEARADVDKRASTKQMREGHDQLLPASPRPDGVANEWGPSTRCLIVLYDATGMYLGSDVVALPFAAHECRRDHLGVMHALNEALVRNGAAPADGIDAMRIEINPLWTPPYQR